MMAAVHWGDSYAPVVYQWFRTGVDAVNSIIPVLFDVQSSDKANEYRVGVGAVPKEQWDMYEAKGDVAHVDIDQGYGTTFTHVEKPVRFTLLRKHIDDDTLPQEGLFAVGLSAAQRREFDAASVFDNAFSSSFTGADGVSLCNASHPYGPDNTGQTAGNTGTSAFSYAAITATRVDMRQFPTYWAVSLDS
jgi:hypothetical protein